MENLKKLFCGKKSKYILVAAVALALLICYLATGGNISDLIFGTDTGTETGTDVITTLPQGDSSSDPQSSQSSDTNGTESTPGSNSDSNSDSSSDSNPNSNPDSDKTPETTQNEPTPGTTSASGSGSDSTQSPSKIDPDGKYTTKEDVSLYLYTYGHLPSNFVTKTEARAKGWEGGSLEPYYPGCCIGGDKFGNHEGLLPKKNGRQYYECDIDTMGADARGAKRIVYSNDGLIYYTQDHYEHFTLLYGNP